METLIMGDNHTFNIKKPTDAVTLQTQEALEDHKSIYFEK